MLLAKIGLDAAGICDKSIRIIHQANQTAAPRVFLISFDINNQFLAKLLCVECRPALFNLHSRLDFWKKEIYLRRGTGMDRCPILFADVVEEDVQKRLKKILNIVLVTDLERRSIIVTLPQLPRDEMKSLD